MSIITKIDGVPLFSKKEEAFIASWTKYEKATMVISFPVFNISATKYYPRSMIINFCITKYRF